MSDAKIEVAVEMLRRSKQVRAVFEAVYRGKPARKTVAEIVGTTGLTRKQVLTAGKRLADADIVAQGERDGDTAYAKHRLYQANRDTIRRRAASRHRLRRSTPHDLSRHLTGAEDDRVLPSSSRDAPQCQHRPIQVFNCSSFHPEVTRVCGALFKNGHYEEATRKALILFNNSVKEKAARPLRQGGNELDGGPLMLGVFSPNAPILRINELRSTSDKDEQQGYMLLTQGAMIGLRNPRSHEHTLKDNPAEAREIIGLVSYLMRRLDTAKKRRRHRQP